MARKRLTAVEEIQMQEAAAILPRVEEAMRSAEVWEAMRDPAAWWRLDRMQTNLMLLSTLLADREVLEASLVATVIWADARRLKGLDRLRDLCADLDRAFGWLVAP